MVSRAMKAAPGSRTEGALEPPAPAPAPLSAQTSSLKPRIRHNGRHNRTLRDIPRIPGFLSRRTPASAGGFKFCEIWKNCNRRFDARRRRSGVAGRTGVHNTVGRGAAEPARRGIRGSRVVGWRRTRRLVFRSSTSAEVAHILSRLEYHGRVDLVGLGHLAVDLVKIGLHPTHAGNLDFAILGDPENAGNVSQPVSV